MGRLAIVGSLLIVAAVIAKCSCAGGSAEGGRGRLADTNSEDLDMHGAGGAGIPLDSYEAQDSDWDFSKAEPGPQPDRKPDRRPDRKPNRKPDRRPDRKPNRKPDRQPDRQPGREPHRKPDSGGSRSPDSAPVVCFIRGRAFERPGSLRFTVGAVPLNTCTHIVYSFLETNNKTGKYTFRKRGGQKEKAILKSLASLKKRKSNLKVLFSYGEGAHTNSLLKQLRSKQAQAAFVRRTQALLKGFRLDGVNFHLEGPAPSVCHKGKATKILQFIKALRAQLGSKVLITFQLPACRDVKCAPRMQELSRLLNYLFLITFDYKLDDLSKTKLTSGLYYYQGNRKTSIETESCLDRWVNANVPKYKIIPGLATHGRTFTLDNPKNNGVSAKLKKKHPLGYGANFTKTDGYMDYVETCRRAKYFHWKREWVKYAATPYMHYKNQWISYDDVDSAVVKANWIRKHWYGGIFVWSADADDYLGNCVGKLFPMIHAAGKPFQGYNPFASKGTDGNHNRKNENISAGEACSSEEEDLEETNPNDADTTTPYATTPYTTTPDITTPDTTIPDITTPDTTIPDTTSDEPTTVPRCKVCPCTC